jgi:hypothetical protein
MTRSIFVVSILTNEVPYGTREALKHAYDV